MLAENELSVWGSIRAQVIYWHFRLDDWLDLADKQHGRCIMTNTLTRTVIHFTAAWPLHHDQHADKNCPSFHSSMATASWPTRWQELSFISQQHGHYIMTNTLTRTVPHFTAAWPLHHDQHADKNCHSFHSSETTASWPTCWQELSLISQQHGHYIMTNTLTRTVPHFTAAWPLHHDQHADKNCHSFHSSMATTSWPTRWQELSLISQQHGHCIMTNTLTRTVIHFTAAWPLHHDQHTDKNCHSFHSSMATISWPTRWQELSFISQQHGHCIMTNSLTRTVIHFTAAWPLHHDQHADKNCPSFHSSMATTSWPTRWQELSLISQQHGHYIMTNTLTRTVPHFTAAWPLHHDQHAEKNCPSFHSSMATASRPTRWQELSFISQQHDHCIMTNTLTRTVPHFTAAWPLHHDQHADKNCPSFHSSMATASWPTRWQELSLISQKSSNQSNKRN